jgi:hypothetical protein
MKYRTRGQCSFEPSSRMMEETSNVLQLHARTTEPKTLPYLCGVRQHTGQRI